MSSLSESYKNQSTNATVLKVTLSYDVTNYETYTRISASSLSFTSSGRNLYASSSNLSFTITLGGTTRTVSLTAANLRSGSGTKSINAYTDVNRGNSDSSVTVGFEASGDVTTGSPYNDTSTYSGGKSTEVTVPAHDGYTVYYYDTGNTQSKPYGGSVTILSGPSGDSTSQFYTWDGSDGNTHAPGSSYSTNADLTLYAKWKYRVYYDANGGTGAPSADWPVEGTSYAVTSSTPTRNNYQFNSWNTSADGSGTSYAPRASLTSYVIGPYYLYAIWNPQITYNGNGGSGVPAAEYKTFGAAYTIPSTTPTKDGNAFVKWNTSSSGSGTDYSPGDTIPASMNTALTLYAVWRKSAASPTIRSMSVVRCDSSGTSDDEGSYAKVTVTWSVDTTSSGMAENEGVVSGTWQNTESGTATSINTWSGTYSGATSGTATAVVYLGDGSTDYQYYFDVTVSNTVAEAGYSVLSSSMRDILTRAEFVMDFRAGGKGVGIGTAAPSFSGRDGSFEVGWYTQFDDDVSVLGEIAAKNLTEYDYSSGVLTASGSWGCSSQVGWSCWHLRLVRLTVSTTSAITAGTTAYVGSLATSGSGDDDGHSSFTGYGSAACRYGAVVISGASLYVYPFVQIPENTSFDIIALYRH